MKKAREREKAEEVEEEKGEEIKEKKKLCGVYILLLCRYRHTHTHKPSMRFSFIIRKRVTKGKQHTQRIGVYSTRRSFTS